MVPVCIFCVCSSAILQYRLLMTFHQLAGRLPFIQKGVVAQLAEATNGISVVMEHRYYGKSMPTKDLSTESLRFLTTEQSLADTVYFVKNVVFEGFEDEDLTAPNTPYILYGGSYAGGQVVCFSHLILSQPIIRVYGQADRTKNRPSFAPSIPTYSGAQSHHPA